jgi:PAS domain S-box-containing protein
MTDTKKTRAELIRDIAELRAQLAAAPGDASEKKIESIFRAAPVGIGMVINRVLAEVNDTLCRMIGYSADELIGQSTRILYPSDQDFEYVGREKYRQIHVHGTGSVETRWRRKDGSVIDIILSSTPLDTEDLSKGVTFTALDITERNRAEAELRRIEWMLSRKPPSLSGKRNGATAGDGSCDTLTALNANGLILSSVGKDLLQSIAEEYLGLIGTSSAIYEKNGDYAFGIFSSQWCRRMDRASRALCGAQNDAAILASGKWLCHESCWTDCSREAIARGESVDVACHGGLRLYCEPILADGKVIGAINFGYGDPPRDPAALRALAELYQIDYDELRNEAENFDSRPQYIVDMAKTRLRASARLIGTLVERRQAEQALRESAAKYKELSNLLESLFDAIPDVLGIQDADHGMIRYNRAGYELLRCSQAEVAGKKCFEKLNRSEPCAACATSDVYRTKQAARVEKHAEELGRWLDCRAYPVLDEAGNIVRVIEHLHDITERKRAEADRLHLEQQIQQAQKMESLGVMAGGIAHDFNNILMAVMGNAELAMMKLSPLSPGVECLQEIVIATRRAAELCRQMLAYAGRASFEMQAINLGELIEEMGHLLKTTISKKALLNLHLEQGLPPIHADPSQIRQVVMNLIINASDAIGERSGVITVAAGATHCDEDYLRKTHLHNDLTPGLYVHLEVSDTGCGMSPETLSRIFEPFFTTKFTGRGLGLAAVIGIVRSHHGALKVYSELGKGTTFKILLPVMGTSAGPALDPAAGATVDNWRGSGTVLLVDDEESLRALGAKMLGAMGFSVLLAADGRDAVDLYRQRGGEIALVLLDLTMPRMDGIQAFGELRQINPAVRVVIASGYNEKETAARVAGKGLSGVIQKPYSTKDLKRVLRQALEPGNA